MNRRISEVVVALGVIFVGIFVLAIQKPYIKQPTTWQTRSNGTHEWARTVVMISFDGLKPEYLTSGRLPTLFNISQGVWPPSLQQSTGILTTKAMKPVSPSLTFPNHWSLQTGLQPSSHGIVANDFHTTLSNASFYYTDPSRSWDEKWWKGTSIWEQLEKLNIKTANLMWPGPPRTSSGISSYYFQKYEKKWSLQNRLDKIMSWLDKDDDERPRFICGYVPDVDTVTHDMGPDVQNKAVQATLEYVDHFFFDILKGLKEREASSLVDVIVVSDHGMTATSNNRLLYLEDLLGPSLHSQLQHWDGWPNVGLQFADESLVQAASLRLRKKENVPYRVATREELVEVWGWEMTDLVKERTAELWILPDVGWSVTTLKEMESHGQDYHPKGNHGYDALEADMNAFFLALGPSVQSRGKTELQHFANLEVHNLVMDMLLIPATDRAPNNGTLGFWDRYISAT